jgi:hypothetical protein
MKTAYLLVPLAERLRFPRRVTPDTSVIKKQQAG